MKNKTVYVQEHNLRSIKSANIYTPLAMMAQEVGLAWMKL